MFVIVVVLVRRGNIGVRERGKFMDLLNLVIVMDWFYLRCIYWVKMLRKDFRMMVCCRRVFKFVVNLCCLVGCVY